MTGHFWYSCSYTVGVHEVERGRPVNRVVLLHLTAGTVAVQ